jgi:hypothetical protein
MKPKRFLRNFDIYVPGHMASLTADRIIYYGKHISSRQDRALSQTNTLNTIDSLRSSLQPEDLNLCQHRSENINRAFCA